MKKIIALIQILAVLAAFIPLTANATTCGFGSDIGGGKCRGYITATGSGTFNVPSDWNSSNNTIEVIGGGGAGGGNGDDGGGGGGYSELVNASLTPSATVGVSVGAGGVTANPSNSGSDTWLCNANSNCTTIGGTAVIVGAKAGQGTISSHLGGQQPGNTGGIGTVLNLGGNGGATLFFAGGGGGGAAGLNGNGNTGSPGTGGGPGPGGAGGQGDVTFGGAGGTAGTSGVAGGIGGNGTEWDSVPHGSGGGGGGGFGINGAGASSGGNGGSYGGGGGGGGFNNVAAVGGNGIQGIIVITYSPGGAASFIKLPNIISWLGWW